RGFPEADDAAWDATIDHAAGIRPLPWRPRSPSSRNSIDLARRQTADGNPHSGSDRGSPNHGSTLLSNRVMARIRLPASVRTNRPVPWRGPPPGGGREGPNARRPLAPPRPRAGGP